MVLYSFIRFYTGFDMVYIGVIQLFDYRFR